MNHWLRLYDSVVDDPKVQRLPAPTFRFWVNCLCLACRHGGTLPPMADMCFSLRLTEAQVRKQLRALSEADLLDESEDGLRPHNWNARQFKADVSTERVKRFRERRTKRDVKRDETVARNAPDTEQSRTETEKETSSLRSETKKRKTALPPDAPSESDVAWAKDRWLQRGRADLCTLISEHIQGFRDYHTSNDTRSADWSASWRTWAQNAMNFSKRLANGSGRPPTAHENLQRGTLLALERLEGRG